VTKVYPGPNTPLKLYFMFNVKQSANWSILGSIYLSGKQKNYFLVTSEVVDNVELIKF